MAARKRKPLGDGRCVVVLTEAEVQQLGDPAVRRRIVVRALDVAGGLDNLWEKLPLVYFEDEDGKLLARWDTRRRQLYVEPE